MIVRSCFFQLAGWSAAVMLLFRRCSSGSVSKLDEPSSVRPSRVVTPAPKSSASLTMVLPTPPCPTTTTFRIRETSLGIVSSVALIDDAEPVQREELVHRADGGRLGLDQMGQAAGGEDLRPRVVLLADALDEPVDEAGVPEDHAGLDGVDRVAADHARRPHQRD